MKIKLLSIIGFLLVFSGIQVFAQGHSDFFAICDAANMQGWPQACYDYNSGVYLVVWEEYRSGEGSDIYGQIVAEDGTLIGGNIAICASEGDQYWPRLDFDPDNNRFLIVFEDHRGGWEFGDISGVFIDSEGNYFDAPTSGQDHTFGICTNMANIYTCSVAFNYLEDVYLVVWGDFRNDSQGASFIGADVFGQLVAADGTLLAPPEPANPVENFAVAASEMYYESVPDVTFNELTNEFYVAYGTDWGYDGQGNAQGYVLGQRVDYMGQLINPDGTVSQIAKSSGANAVDPAQFISLKHMNGPDCFQARVTARTEYTQLFVKAADVTSTEVQVVWKGRYTADGTNDVYGQRIGFEYNPTTQRWVSKYINKDGEETQDVSNFNLGIHEGWAGPTDIAYSQLDDEYLVAWGAEPKGDYDLYVQRMWIDDTEKLNLLADDRVNTVPATENIPVDVTTEYEGSLLGVAHSTATNDFLVAYTFGDEGDIYGHMFYGTEPPPSGVEGYEALRPDGFALKQNYPNPFNSETVIAYQVKEACHVSLSLYNINGQKIRSLVNRNQLPGFYQARLNSRDLTSGVYFYQIQMGDNFKDMKKMVIVE